MGCAEAGSWRGSGTVGRKLPGLYPQRFPGTPGRVEATCSLSSSPPLRLQRVLSQVTSPRTLSSLLTAVPSWGPGASEAPSHLLLYIQRTLDSPPGRLRRADDTNHLSKLDAAAGASCILASATSGDGCRSSWLPLARPYVAPKLQGFCVDGSPLVFPPACLPLLLASIAFIRGQPREDGSRQPCPPSLSPAPSRRAEDGSGKSGSTRMEEKSCGGGRSRWTCRRRSPAFFPPAPDAPPKPPWTSSKNTEHRRARGGRKSVCDRKSTETLQAEICSALLPLCRRS